MPVIFEQDQFRMQPQSFAWPSKDSVIDTAGADLVKALSRVGWEVPGIDVEFATTGAGKNLFRRVCRVSGVTEDGPFELSFSNEQDRRGRFYVLTGIGRATVPPGFELELYTDRSPTIVHRYVGDDWKADGGSFIKNLKVNSRLNGKPRTYVTYKGHQSLLKPDEDLGREYGAAPHEPAHLVKSVMIDAVAAFINDKLLPRLSAMPAAEGHDDITDEGDANLRRLVKVDTIPMPDDFPTLYAWVRSDDAYRIQSRGNSYELGEGDHVISGTGYRLVSLGGNQTRERLHPRAHDGFCYASADPTVRAGQVVQSSREDSYPVEIKLKSLNDVFVVDNARFCAVRDGFIDQARAEGRDRITDAELNESILATARTIVPVTEYHGGYGKPTYLIGRQLFADEARLMEGDIEVILEGDGARTMITDNESGLEMVLYPIGDRFGHRRTAERVAEDAARLLAESRSDFEVRDMPTEVGRGPAASL